MPEGHEEIPCVGVGEGSLKTGWGIMVGSCVVLTMRLVLTGICFSLLLGFQAAFGRLGQPETLFGVANGFAVCVVLGRQSVGSKLLSFYRVLQDFAGVMRYGAATAGCHLGCSDVRRFLSESRRRAIGGLWWGVCEWGA